MSPRKLIPAASLLLVIIAASVWAGDGHDHGDAPPTANSNGPKRLPDGSVFLPKPAQRQIGVRTLPVEAGELPRTIELAGKVVMDPNAGGKVQAMVAGRLEAGPKGFPSMGQSVRKGDVLAFLSRVVRDKEYLKMTIRPTPESLNGASPKGTTCRLEHCMLVSEPLDISTEDAAALVKPTITITYNWKEYE